jgi:hypothetical protein
VLGSELRGSGTSGKVPGGNQGFQTFMQVSARAKSLGRKGAQAKSRDSAEAGEGFTSLEANH